MIIIPFTFPCRALAKLTASSASSAMTKLVYQEREYFPSLIPLTKNVHANVYHIDYLDASDGLKEFQVTIESHLYIAVTRACRLHPGKNKRAETYSQSMMRIIPI